MYTYMVYRIYYTSFQDIIDIIECTTQYTYTQDNTGIIAQGT